MLSHEERVWWLLAPNPFVILADAAPRVPPKVTRDGNLIRVEDYDPLSQIRREGRRLRQPTVPYYTYTYDEQGNPVGPAQEDRPVWPYGLGFCALLGLGAVFVSAVRLRTPTKRLARGVRVA